MQLTPAGSVSRHSVSVLAVVNTAGGGVVTGGSVVGDAGGGVFLVVAGIAVSAGIVLEITGKRVKSFQGEAISFP